MMFQLGIGVDIFSLVGSIIPAKETPHNGAKRKDRFHLYTKHHIMK